MTKKEKALSFVKEKDPCKPGVSFGVHFFQKTLVKAQLNKDKQVLHLQKRLHCNLIANLSIGEF